MAVRRMTQPMEVKSRMALVIMMVYASLSLWHLAVNI